MPSSGPCPRARPHGPRSVWLCLLAQVYPGLGLLQAAACVGPVALGAGKQPAEHGVGGPQGILGAGPEAGAGCGVGSALRPSAGASKREKQYQAHPAFGDRRDGVISARTYFYANEAKCDSHMETFLRCIEASGGASLFAGCPLARPSLGRPAAGGRAVGVREARTGAPTQAPLSVWAALVVVWMTWGDWVGG